MSTGVVRSWGNNPAVGQVALPCYWRHELSEKLAKAQDEFGTILPYGNGLSYGDSCLAASDHVLRIRPINRFMNADWVNGIVKAEAGTTLGEILAITIPHGWFLPVTPGTKHVTLGGAIANDVHGKNHHRRGTFGRYVRSFGLLRSDRGHLNCSASEQPDLYAATIGGLGLTGIIEWAEIQLEPIRSSRIDHLKLRFRNLDEFFEISHELDHLHEFCVSWFDCAAPMKSLGRGVYIAGDFAPQGTLNVQTSRALSVPFTPTVSLINPLTLRALSSLYSIRAPLSRRLNQVDYDRFLYPLDRITHWNRVYGRDGLQQYQCVIPRAQARPALKSMLSAIAKSRMGSPLAVIKQFGTAQSPGLLSFPVPGTTLALDFPHTGRLENLLSRLDGIVREAGGRLYPAKDARMCGEDFRRAYPAWERLDALRDPALLSRFWQRVTR